jgi:hypothetical protein
MQVQIKPHIGKHLKTGKPVTLDQNQVFVDGKRVAYCGTKAGRPINFIAVEVDPNVVKAVVAAVTEQVGAPNLDKVNFCAGLVDAPESDE